MFCHKKGHIVQNCFKKQNQNNVKNNNNSKNENIKSVKTSSNSNITNENATSSFASMIVPSENYQGPEQNLMETVRVDEI